MAFDKDNKEQHQDDYAYAINPASQLNLNINLTELPKCPKCKEGVLLPIQSTTNPRSIVSTIYTIGWVCTNCEENILYVNGKLVRQPLIKETESPL
ncbi:MAG: hypothetical protein WC516_08730 [Patescibacteria group bacterium]|jgi:hypothetical protein